jgi:putrescine importer
VSAAVSTNKTSLKAGGIGLLGAATLGIVMLSPAMTLYGTFGPSYLAAGNGAPWAFLIALFATIPTATSYALLSRDFPDAGSASSWIARVASPWIARWASWMVFLYYLDNFIIQPVTCGVFFNDLLSVWNFHGNFLTFTIAAILCCAFAARLVYRGISLSTKGALTFLSFETTVVFALCVTVIYSAVHHGQSLSLEPFAPQKALTNTSGLFQAMVFGMLAFCGFDVISTLSEETHMPRAKIPQATFLSLVLFGVFVIVGIWSLTYAGTVGEFKTIADAGGMPISAIAKKFWGAGSALVPLTAISAALGISIATSVGASRVLYSSARGDRVHKGLSFVHPKFQVPWNALHVVFGAGVISSIVSAIFLGPYNSYVWWATTSTYFVMLTYFIVNAANILIFRKKVFTSFKNFALHGALPFVGLVMDTVILIRSFFMELWAQDWATGKSVVVFDVAFALLALGVSIPWVTRKNLNFKSEQE